MKRSNLFARDCFVACAPRNDIPSSLMRCHCCSSDRLPLFWNAPHFDRREKSLAPGIIEFPRII
ncbi:hypothetical protein AUK22_01690 [bacterium CG2_30_54_10]|nr:MAG: hypothetical protein AUK22_01690 [bacterium CG2_30_54_10]